MKTEARNYFRAVIRFLCSYSQHAPLRSSIPRVLHSLEIRDWRIYVCRSGCEVGVGLSCTLYREDDEWSIGWRSISISRRVDPSHGSLIEKHGSGTSETCRGERTCSNKFRYVDVTRYATPIKTKLERGDTYGNRGGIN